MAITFDTGRQYPLVESADFVLGDLTSGEAVPLIKLPQGATVIGGTLTISTVFNSTSSDAIDIGDDGDANRYTASPVSGQALACTELSLTGYTYSANNTVDITWTSGGGTPTTGAGTVRVMYVLDGRSHEVQPT